jgi:HEAT repeat protein
MHKKRVILFSGIGLCIAAAIFCIAHVESQPRYNGKTVYELSRMVAASAGERRLFCWTDQQVADALTGLRTLGPRAEKALISQTQTRDTGWRRSKAYTTIWLRSPPWAQRVLPPYVVATYWRTIAVVAISKLGALSPQGEHALVLACQDPDVVVRARAVWVLGYHGSRSPETLRALQEALRNPQVAGLVGNGEQALGFDSHPRTVEEMALGLSRPFVEARYQAASALCDLGPQAQPAIPALIEACSEPEDMVRICCIRALGRIGPAASNAIPRLQALLKDESSTAQRAAAEAIQQIEGP